MILIAKGKEDADIVRRGKVLSPREEYGIYGTGRETALGRRMDNVASVSPGREST